MTHANPRGFTIMELMTVIAVISVLAAISVPLYQRYTLRAESTEIVVLFDEMRSGLQASLQQGAVQQCSDILDDIPAFETGHAASLTIAFTALGGVQQNGYRPSLHVVAQPDQHGARGMGVARALYEQFSELERIEAGGVAVEGLMYSFNIPLSDSDSADCFVPVPDAASGQSTNQLTGNPQGNTPPAVTPPANPPAPVCRMVYDAPISWQDIGMTEIDRSRRVLNPGSGNPTGSQCMICGDSDTGSACSDLDLILGVTNKCPDTHPYCMTTTKGTGSGLQVFGSCVDELTAVSEPPKNPAGGCYQSADGSIGMTDTPGLTCHKACYGDGCNITASADTPATRGLPPAQGRLVCQ